MDIGFIGLGNMGFPIASRILAAGHPVVVFDTQPDVVDRAVTLGARAATSPKDVADRTDAVMASLPSLQASADVAIGPNGVIDGRRARRFIDLSTIGSQVAQHNHACLSERGFATLDAPVSGGVNGARNGTLAVMVSGPRSDFDAMLPVLQTIGRPIFVSEKPGAAQTMKLVNNLMAATTLAATAEVMVMGVKAGLDADVMIDVLNAGSGGTHASRDKFPRAVLPRTFDYGFAAGLMVKDVRLYLQEAERLGIPAALSQAVATLWENLLEQQGPESDFTTIIRPLEDAAGVTVAGRAATVQNPR